jgi:TPR repeat protein
VSSPIDRSFRTSGISPYAPKWARDLDSELASGPLGQRLHAAGRDQNVSPEKRPDFEAEPVRAPPSLAPSLVPEPPTQKSWLRKSSRALMPDGDGGMIFSYLFAILLAAMVAFVIVVELPNILNFVSKKRAAANSFGERFAGDAPRPLVELAPGAAEAKLASVAHSDSAPQSADQPTEAPGRAGVAPVARSVPAASTQVAVATPAPANQAPAISQTANPEPVMVSPSAAEPASRASSVHDTNVKTAPVQPDQPARPLGRDDIETLLKQGNDFVSVGDFASARIVFRRAWEANDPQGALALAATYDPIALRSIDAKGAIPDETKAREWYIKARDRGSPDAAQRLKVLADRGTAFVASRSSAISSDNGAAIALTGAERPSEAVSPNSQQNEAPTPPGSYWKQRESVMRLDAVGVSRKFYFYIPSDAQLKAGAKAGSLRFEGQIAGAGYTGTAFSYSAKCGRAAFPVSGQIENDDGRVVLFGRIPKLDGNCREIGKVDQKLVFDLMKIPPR